MASGDAQRVWFPEMVDELAAWWNQDVTWDALAEFCDRMGEVRGNIRRSRGIKAPMFRCPKCGNHGRSEKSQIGIGSALFALRKAGVISDEQFQDLDRSWKKYQRKNMLDGYGKKKGARPAHRNGACG